MKRLAERDDLPTWLKQGPAQVRFGREWLGQPERIEAWLDKYWTRHFEGENYPHVTSNSHYKYLPEFSPRNVVDGNVAAAEQASQVPCWRPNKRIDLWLKIEFGRTVEMIRVVLYLRKLPNQEKTWSSATLEFSNGHKVSIALKNTAAAQEFVFPNQLTAWVKLTDLRETFPLGGNGVAECEVYGKDVEVRQREVDGSSPHVRSAASTTAVLPASSD